MSHTKTDFIFQKVAQSLGHGAEASVFALSVLLFLWKFQKMMAQTDWVPLWLIFDSFTFQKKMAQPKLNFLETSKSGSARTPLFGSFGNFKKWLRQCAWQTDLFCTSAVRWQKNELFEMARISWVYFRFTSYFEGR